MIFVSGTCLMQATICNIFHHSFGPFETSFLVNLS
jgi:hypothetical protein